MSDHVIKKIWLDLNYFWIFDTFDVVLIAYVMFDLRYVSKIIPRFNVIRLIFVECMWKLVDLEFKAASPYKRDIVFIVGYFFVQYAFSHLCIWVKSIKEFQAFTLKEFKFVFLDLKNWIYYSFLHLTRQHFQEIDLYNQWIWLDSICKQVEKLFFVFLQIIPVDNSFNPWLPVTFILIVKCFKD